MENKDVKTRNRSKITVVALTVFLLLCAVTCVGTLIMRKDNEVSKEPEHLIVDGAEISASDEKTLRELLLEDAELVIDVTEDIVIDEPMLVNGTKKLTGAGSISMALYVQPYQYMLEVQKGANLIFDGVTVDGNGSSNCVKAEKDTEVTVLSGKLTYGCPTIIESFGDVYLKGGSIVDAVGTGMYIHSGGNAYLTGGNIQGCVDGAVETAIGSYLSVSDNVILQDNMEYFIYNRGTCDITGGTLRHAGLDMVYSSGVMNIKYPGEDGGMLEWYDIEGCAIVVGNGGEVNVDGLHIKDVTNRAVTTAAGESVANISNSLFENTKGDTIYVRTEVNLKNVEIKNSKLSGIMLIETGKATVENVTVTGTGKDGIQNGGGVVTGKNLVVNNAGRIGVNSYKYKDVAGSVTLENVTVNGTEKSNGLHCETSTLTVSNAKIYDVAGEGARAQKKGTLNLTNVQIQNSKGYSIASYDAGSKVILKNVKTTGGKRGVGAFGGNVTGTKVTVLSPTEYGVTGSKKGVIEITDLTIKDSEKTGVNANDATINITNATIENPKATAAVNADYAGKITLKNADVKFPEGVTASVDGVRAVSPANVTLEKVNFTNVPGRAVYANGEKAKIAVTDITTTGGKRGIQVFKAGQVEGTNVTIASPSEYGISCGDKGSGFNLTNLTITECGKHGLNVYDGAVATATDVTITKPAQQGVFVGNEGKLTLNNIAILEAGENGIYNVNGTVTLKEKVEIEKPGQRGIRNDGGIVDASTTTVEIKNPKAFGVSTNVSVKKVEGQENVVTPGTTTIKTLNVTGAEGYSAMTVNGVGTVVTVNGGTISDSKGHGVNASEGTLKLSNVTIKDSQGYGVEAQENSKVELTNVKTIGGKRGVACFGGNVTGKNVTVESPAEFGVTGSQKGTVKITELTVKDSGKTGVNANDATISITKATIENPKATAGVNADNSGKVTLKDAEIKFAKGTSKEIDGVKAVSPANVTLENVDFVDVPGRAVYADGKEAKIAASDITTTGGKRGIQIYNGGQVEGKKVSIASPSEYGISCGNEGSGFNLTDVTVTGCGKHGVNVYENALATLTNAKITGTTQQGVYVGNKAELTLNGITIKEAGENGIYNSNATVTLKGEINIEKPGTKGVEREDRGIKNEGGIVDAATAVVTVTNPKGFGVSTNVFVEKAEGKEDVVTPGTTTIKTLNVTDAEGYSAMTVNGAGTVVTVNGGTITGSKGHGVNASDGTLKLNNVSIKDFVGYGVEAQKDSTVELEGVVITDGERGIQLKDGGYVKGGTVTITSPSKYGIACATASSFEIANLSVSESGSHAVNVYEGSTAKVTNKLTITDAGSNGIACSGSETTFDVEKLEVKHSENKAVSTASHGVNVYEGAKLTVNDGTITNPGEHGANVDSSATLVMKSVDIAYEAGQSKDASGVKACNNATVTLNKVNISNAPQYGIVLWSGADIANTESVKSEDITITDSKTHALWCADKGSSFDISNLVVNRSGDTGVSASDKAVYLSSEAEGTLTGASIAYAGKSNLYVTSKAKVTINDKLTTYGGTNSIAVYGSATVTKGNNGGNVEINSPSSAGVRCYDEGSSMNVDDLKVYMNNKGTYGVEVGKKGSVTTASGTISQPGKHGAYVLSGATLTLNGTTNITLTDTNTNHGIYVNNSNSKVIADNLVITDGARGIQLDDYGRFEGNSVTINSSSSYGIGSNTGTIFEIENLTVNNSGNHAVNVYSKAASKVTGKLTIVNAGDNGIACSGSGDGKKTTFEVAELEVKAENQEFSAARFGVNVYGGAELTVNGGTITNPASNGAFANEASTLNLKNVDIVFDKDRTDSVNGVYADGVATVTLEGVDITDAPRFAIYMRGNTANTNVDGADIKATLKNVTTTGGLQGIQIYNSAFVSGENVTIISPKNYGVAAAYANDSDKVVADFNITNLVINKADGQEYSCGNSGVYLSNNANGTVNGGTITSPKEHGFKVEKGSTLTLTGELSINTPKLSGIVNAGGTVVGDVEGKLATVTVTSPGEYGVTTTGGGSTTIQTVNVTQANSNPAVNAEGANTKVTINGGAITNNGGHGTNVIAGATLTMNNVGITLANDPDKSGVYVSGENSKAIVNTVSITDGGRGIQLYDKGRAEGNTVTIRSSKNYAVAAGSNSSFEITNVNVLVKDGESTSTGKSAINVYDGATGTVNGGTITNPSSHGANVDSRGTLNLTDVGITYTAGRNDAVNGVNAVGIATVSLKGVDVVKAPQYGLYVDGNGENTTVDGADVKVTVEGVTTTGGKRGIQIYNSGSVSGEDVEIITPSAYGIACGNVGKDGVASNFDITDLIVNRSAGTGYSSGDIAVNVYGGAQATINGGAITNPAKHGVNVDGAATALTLKSNVNIIFDAGRTAGTGANEIQGVRVNKGTLTLEGKLSITNSVNRGLRNEGGTVNGLDAIVEVNNPGTYGVATSGAGTTQIGILNITGSKGFSSMTVNDSGTNVTINGGKISGSNGYGVNASRGTLTMNKCEITGSGQKDVYAEVNSTINLNNMVNASSLSTAYGGYNASKGEKQGIINIQ